MIKKIAISAGHNPAHSGASFNDIFTEHGEAVKWVECLLRYGEEQGVEFVAVPTGSLTSKVSFINKHNVDAAIEIHFNSAKNAEGKHIGRGCETIYCPNSEKGEDLAFVIQVALGQHFKPTRGTKAGWYRMDRPGVVDYAGDVDGDEHPDYFLAKTNCPAIIIEPEFVHNYQKIRQNMEACCCSIVDVLKQVKGD